jgi:hypothetical protein
MIHFYAMHDEDGVVYGYRRTSTNLSHEPGYTEVTEEKHQVDIRNGRKGFRVVDGHVIRAHEVRLSTSNQVLLCDGVTDVEITVLRVPEDGWPVGISINGTHYDVEKDDPIQLVSSETGAWIVDIDDDRFSCTGEVRIEGVAVSDFDRAVQRKKFLKTEEDPK